MTTREELKALRQRAMGVVGTSRSDTAAMYERIIEHGDKVAAIRAEAEQAHIDELNTQIADLKEDAEELIEFGQAARPLAGTAPKAAAPITKPPGNEALAALEKTQPNPPAGDIWADGNAYHGTNGENTRDVQTIKAGDVGDANAVLNGQKPA